MKRTLYISIIALAAASLASCNKDGSFENKLFYDTTSFKNEIRVATDEGTETLTKSVSVAMARPEANDVVVKFERRDDLLETYRAAYYDSEAELLPSANCDIEGLQAVIRSGDVSSPEVSISFKGLDKLDYSKQYVVPVSFTMECLVNCHAFNNDSKILTIMGVEDHFLIRIGDVQIPTNQIQVACAVVDTEGGTTYRAHATDASLQLKKDRWYHIAVTFDKGLIKVYLDGKLRVETDVHQIANRPNSETGQLDPVYFESVNFGAPHSDEMDGKPRCFWIGYSYDSNRCLDGMIAEARVWNRVLSIEEINKPNHFYKVYASEIDESLLAYWKFDEGTGKTVRDYSLYGHDLTADHDFVWYPVELPVKD